MPAVLSFTESNTRMALLCVHARVCVCARACAWPQGVDDHDDGETRECSSVTGPVPATRGTRGHWKRGTAQQEGERALGV